MAKYSETDIKFFIERVHGSSNAEVLIQFLNDNKNEEYTASKNMRVRFFNNDGSRNGWTFKLIEKYAAKGWGCHIALGDIEGETRSRENVKSCRVLLIEQDNDKDIPNFGLEPSFTVDTRSGYHFFFVLKECEHEKISEWETAMYSLSNEFYTDDISQSNHLIRLAGTSNFKNGDSYLTSIIQKSNEIYSYTDIYQMANRVEKNAGSKADFSEYEEIDFDINDKELSALKKFLINKNSSYQAACFLKIDCSLSNEETMNLLKYYIEATGRLKRNKEYSDQYLSNKLESAVKYGQGEVASFWKMREKYKKQFKNKGGTKKRHSNKRKDAINEIAKKWLKRA